MTSPLAVLGLGPMGQAITRALLSGGRDVTVWNRSPEKATHLEQLRARVAKTPAEAVHGSDLVLLSVRGNDVAYEILNRAGLPSAGPMIVNLSSDTPASARRLASWVTDRGVRYLGGSMLTPSVLVGQPGSTAVLGGDRAFYEEARSVLEVIAPKLTYIGEDPGTVAALDLALLDAFWTTVAGWSHAVAMGRAEGLSSTSLTERMTAMVHLAAQVGAGISQDTESGSCPGDVSTVASAHTTLTHILQASKDKQLDPGIPNAITELLQRAIDHGHQANGPSRLVPTIELGNRQSAIGNRRCVPG